MKRGEIELDGMLGAALAANLRGRLKHFIVAGDSPAIALFSPQHRAGNQEGDWYGEHAGKWLVAAARAAARSGDEELRTHVLAVADYLVSVQEADGYLGTYAPDRRFDRPQPPKPESWDGAPAQRTWDVWVHAYMLLGLLEVHAQFGDDRHLQAARRIGDLCWQAFVRDGIDITTCGNHHGMSATILLEPAVDLFNATGERNYLELAERVLACADREPRLQLLRRALSGEDAAHVGTGKAYQLLWNMVGIVKLHRATGNADALAAALSIWSSVRDHHLTLGGGPWGGVGHRSREVFNPPTVFSPCGYVETCSTLAWIQLNRELFLATGEARFLEEIERSAYNDLLAAQAPDGENWCYYIFPNGRRVHTTYWRCCKSSGAMALEELPRLACAFDEDHGLTVGLWSALRAEFKRADEQWIVLSVESAWPFDGDAVVRLELPAPATFPLHLRIPSWAQRTRVSVNGEDAAAAIVPGEFLIIERTWRSGDSVRVEMPMRAELHVARNRNIQESRAPDGEDVRQCVLDQAWVALTRGPLAYATSLVDGYKTEETIRLPALDATQAVTETPGDGVPELRLHPLGRPPIPFRPYPLADDREDGRWRLTWLSLAPDAPSQQKARAEQATNAAGRT